MVAWPISIGVYTITVSWEPKTPNTEFYHADGNRTLTIYGTGTSEVKVYTPFPDFEESIPASGATTQRTSYTLAGQLIAVRVRTGTTGDGTLRYAYSDHLGSVSAWSDSAGVYLPNSTALFEPYGGFRIQPLATVNPGVSDRGFTGPVSYTHLDLRLRWYAV